MTILKTKEIEKEVKILNAGATVETALILAGATFYKEEEQENIIYKSAEGSAKLRRTKSIVTGDITYELIRKFSVTDKEYKKFKIKREESMTLTAEQYEAQQQLLPFLGYTEYLRGIKHRKSYKLGDFLYEMDEWEKHIFPVPYLEMECLNHKKSVNKGLEQIWSKKEIKNLILCTDGISDLRDLYEKTQIHPLMKILDSSKKDKDKDSKKSKKSKKK